MTKSFDLRHLVGSNVHRIRSEKKITQERLAEKIRPDKQDEIRLRESGLRRKENRRVFKDGSQKRIISVGV